MWTHWAPVPGMPWSRDTRGEEGRQIGRESGMEEGGVEGWSCPIGTFHIKWY